MILYISLSHEKEVEPQEAPMLFVMTVGQDPVKGAGSRLAPSPIQLKPDAVSDFPVSLCVDQKDDLVFLMTKMSYLYIFDMHIGKTLHRAKITNNTVFVSVQEFTGVMFEIPVTSGKVFRVLMNEQALVPCMFSS